ncbi:MULTISPECIES: rhodanese-like domain-containing protein [unclassified Fusibacter]|uniref:rhodanese-like domain-containing protein n=1 Tax=unclassified Fusibacter TaxID=2624464 RepID=UPI0010114C66|nr:MULTISPECIES: rhodanese-like domain-containing protein [unclassified Fusibacter]MCK8059085.1 rhodanese-like domain-containing protein [Fusibacter sp. A2]NPE22494.1 rhodanese-like domain-containing protein [Fusibacter sp. A1]RXV60598.1 rhodanese-like domain-containing protein [Fusibacter sp. A1]
MKHIRPSELASFIKENNHEVTLIDVRSPGEYHGGNIAGFKNIPLDTLMNNMSSIDFSKPTVVMCHSGSRSLMATRMLEMAGHENVLNLSGGYMAF